MTRQLRAAFGIILVLVSCVILGCTSSKKDSADRVSDEDVFGSKYSPYGGQSGLNGGATDFDQVSNPAAGLDRVGEALDEYPAEDPQQEAAIDSAKQAVGYLSDAWEGLEPGAPVSRVIGYFDIMNRYRSWIYQAAQQAESARLHWLYLILIRQIKKVPVFRFWNPLLGHHFQTLDRGEVSDLHGWMYEGISFFVWQTDTPALISLIPGGKEITLYRCYVPNTWDHFVSTRSNCEGFRQEGPYGKVSSVATQLSPLEAVRLYNPTLGDHLTTLRDPNNPNDPGNEPSFAKQVGWNTEGGQGFPPL